MQIHQKLVSITILAIGTALGSTASADPDVVIIRPAPHVVVTPAPRIAHPVPIIRLAPVGRGPATYCTHYGCSGTITTTGPYGNTVTRSGTRSCTDGICTGTRSVTGPGGETATLDRTISR